MAGPKRGIYLQAQALIEFDLRIKRGAAEDEDLQLIDGAATFSELTPFHGVYTQRIPGDHGAAVDISLALLRQAVEARIQIGIRRIPATGLSLSLSCFVSRIRQEIKLFDGVVDKPGNLGVVDKPGNLENSFVVAVVVKSPLALKFKVARADDMGNAVHRFRGYPARVHGRNLDSIPLDFGTIEVQVSWANLD
ncbi:hypothetical protein BAE44_0019504 [Dichanthelium oligosanthes]|uniref:DUF6598 domain-containing protein n=1 Tax=Dichanthelium oligosanthes TaxID=888268 RepID=A0A1E5V315_9POAL|nr:hypothetical protein BAE44_0019504 [Dichanthelium oligosanthes]